MPTTTLAAGDSKENRVKYCELVVMHIVHTGFYLGLSLYMATFAQIG